MAKAVKLSFTWFSLLIWGSTCFAQASSTSPHIDVSLQGEVKSGVASEVAGLERECAAIEASIEKLARDSKDELEAIKGRLGMLYRFSAVGYAAPLLSSRDMDDALEAGYLSMRLLRSDHELFARFRAKGSEILKLRGVLADKTKEMDALKSRVEGHEKSILAARQAESGLPGRDPDMETYGSAPAVDGPAQGGARKSAFLRKPILKPPSSGFPSLQGALPLPTSGRIANTFGAKSGMALHAGLYGNGVLIKAPKGQSVQAVYDGVVVFADWFKEYGKMMILDHGDHYFTVVAHAEQFLKTVDEPVKRGDAIATVGSSGSTDGPKLYFEIRHFGKPVDPMKWLAVGQLSEE
jgi:septal ring factor EnvC (AmiA/AmiB activator)